MQLERRAFIALVVFAAVACSAQAAQTSRATDLYAEASKSVLKLLVKSPSGEVLSLGSGFAIGKQKIATNAHVIQGGAIFVDVGGAILPLTVDRTDATNDLAIVTTSAELSARPLTLATELPSTGASIYAIGNPAGLERSLSTGVVAGIRTIDGRQLLQITAPISPGSSGGPILDDRGEVVGVAVGALNLGQNLNFAIPSTLLLRLIRGEAAVAEPFANVLASLDQIEEKLNQTTFSLDDDSPWLKLSGRRTEVLQVGLEAAGSDVANLLRIAERAESAGETDIGLQAAERALALKANAETRMALANAMFLKSQWADQSPLWLEKTEKAVRTAIAGLKEPSVRAVYQLADVLTRRGAYEDATNNYLRLLWIAKRTKDADNTAVALRGLILTTDALKQPPATDGYFSDLVASGYATAFDWRARGKRLDAQGRSKEAAESFLQAVGDKWGNWTDWCEAAGSFLAADGREDSVLSSARKCLELGAGKKNSEVRLSSANQWIASVLNSRGVYQEALIHAREAAALDASNAWAFHAQSEALTSLKRPREAVAASQQAVRLSDGKHATMHFQLGSAQFDLENWDLARQSYEKAAQLGPESASAAFNVGLCYARQGVFREAANWAEEALRREPTHSKRNDWLSLIRVWRK